MEIERPALLMGALIASSVALASNTVDKTNQNILFIIVDDL